MVISLRFGTHRIARPACVRPMRDGGARYVSCRQASDSPAAQTMSSEQEEELKKAMEDPAVRERMAALQEDMKKPEVQAQMSQMQAAMSNPQLQARLAELRDDPDLKEMFEDIQKNGMAAMMKYWNDPQLLAKLGAKIGDVAPTADSAASAQAAAAPPEIKDLLDAARYGDEEAVEDFIAIGKDVNVQDAEGRSPLHYAVARNLTKIARALLDGGANVEVQDSKQNTPLHYAAGYGQLDCVEILLDAGASPDVRNHTGKRAADLARLNEKNPVANDEALLRRLEGAV